jgi:predicted O-methyltransferase YrrM
LFSALSSPERFEETWALASRIDGWLSREQAIALADAARAVPGDASIVEIGSHHGRSTVVLAREKPASARLTAVDPFDDPRWGGGEGALVAFRANLRAARLEGDVDVYRGTSREAAETWHGSPVGLLYVDGAHDRASVLTDLEQWEPFVRDGGFVCVHDAFSSPGVTTALLQRHLVDTSFRYLGSVRSLAMFRRERLSRAAASWKALRMTARLAYFGRNILVKVALRRGWQGVARVLGHRGPGYPY